MRIVFDLLRTARRNKGISKTQAVRQTNLSFHSINHYLTPLLARHFLRPENVTGHRTQDLLTGEGEHLYRLLSEVYKLMEN